MSTLASTMPRFDRYRLVAIAVLAGAAGFAATGAGRLLSTPAPAPLPVNPRVPDLVARVVSSGPGAPRDLNLASLQGSVWVAGFLFTRCNGPCPVVMSELVAAARAVPSGVRVIAISVDPDHDTMPVLRRYAARFGASDGLLMARLSRPDVYRLASEGFRLSMFEDRDAAASARFVHTTRLAVVDANGYVRSYHDTADGSPTSSIIQSVRDLLAKGGA